MRQETCTTTINSPRNRHGECLLSSRLLLALIRYRADRLLLELTGSIPVYGHDMCACVLMDAYL